MTNHTFDDRNIALRAQLRDKLAEKVLATEGQEVDLDEAKLLLAAIEQHDKAIALRKRVGNEEKATMTDRDYKASIAAYLKSDQRPVLPPLPPTLTHDLPDHKIDLVPDELSMSVVREDYDAFMKRTDQHPQD